MGAIRRKRLTNSRFDTFQVRTQDALAIAAKRRSKTSRSSQGDIDRRRSLTQTPMGNFRRDPWRKTHPDHSARGLSSERCPGRESARIDDPDPLGQRHHRDVGVPIHHDARACGLSVSHHAAQLCLLRVPFSELYLIGLPSEVAVPQKNPVPLDAQDLPLGQFALRRHGVMEQLLQVQADGRPEASRQHRDGGSG